MTLDGIDLLARIYTDDEDALAEAIGLRDECLGAGLEHSALTLGSDK